MGVQPRVFPLPSWSPFDFFSRRVLYFPVRMPWWWNGRHSGLKILRGQPRAGSNPAQGIVVLGQRPVMGAFIGKSDVGVWASNGQRNELLDWIAENRCSRGDERWQWCKNAAQRWSGRGLDLSELMEAGEGFHVSDSELLAAADKYSPSLAKLLKRVEQISRGEWLHTVDSAEALRLGVETLG